MLDMLAAAHAIDLAKGLLLKLRASLVTKYQRISTQGRLAQYAHINPHRPPLNTLQDTISNIPALIHHQSFSWATPLWLLPSFIQDLISPKPRAKTSHSSKISALDGLRGLACLMVMHMHWSFAVTDSNEGGSAETNTKYLFHRPFFYLLWAGSSHVNVFFVMSGYVLSVKALKMIHAGVSVHSVITSAVFRRAIRIFLPPLVLLFIYLISIRIGVFDPSNAVFESNRNSHEYQIRMFEAPPPILPTLREQFWDVLGAAARLMDPNTQFALPEYGKYDTHLWTMPTEFYCSMALYIILLATCRLYTHCRLILHTLLVLFCWLNSHQTHALFFAGMTIAESDILLKRWLDRWRKSRAEAPSTPIHTSIPVRPLPLTNKSALPLSTYFSPSNIICTLSALLGMYLLSTPILWADATPGYAVLLSYAPGYMSVGQRVDALRAVGALLAVWPITFLSATAARTPIISAILANPVSKYLGQISFAFYLVHGFVIRSLGYGVLPGVYRVVIADAGRRRELAARGGNGSGNGEGADSSARLTSWEVGMIWVLGYMIVLPACVWMADLFWRFVDVKCVSLGRWVEERMVMREREGEGGKVVEKD